MNKEDVSKIIPSSLDSIVDYAGGIYDIVEDINKSNELTEERIKNIKNRATLIVHECQKLLILHNAFQDIEKDN